jgi:hypothetical protein
MTTALVILLVASLVLNVYFLDRLHGYAWYRRTRKHSDDDHGPF